MRVLEAAGADAARAARRALPGPRSRLIGRGLAAIVRLLDVGCFRIGGAAYADEHDTFGVATLHKAHVRVSDGVMCFDYPAKGGIERTLTVADADAGPVVAALRRRRSGSDQLFAFKEGRRWVDVDAHDVNEYIRSAAGDDFSSKDFRTWSGTVLAAVALAADDEAASPTARRRAVRAAVATVAERLGNTPAVSRSSYIDPRVVSGFEAGATIADLLPEAPTLPDPGVRPGRRASARRRAVEDAVIQLLESAPD